MHSNLTQPGILALNPMYEESVCVEGQKCDMPGGPLSCFGFGSAISLAGCLALLAHGMAFIADWLLSLWRDSSLGQSPDFSPPRWLLNAV
jgi:hypothetical protein